MDSLTLIVASAFLVLFIRSVDWGDGRIGAWAALSLFLLAVAIFVTGILTAIRGAMG